MKLRRIDILGFKSFRFKTGLEIADGVTVVVGPNGCGKSNIVDAIRWSIGSQSAKDLRGRAMEDVIFAGSQNHKPMGYAEVSLTLENDGRGDVPVEWRDAAEIKVTRRLFRTGESEYEINGGTCRLRDIHELFLGTGVGAKEAYSIIEQGRIGFIVASRPEERRVIIEEAAGITRYKFQRKTAERRLERTRENLLRVKDVLDEVGRQLASLERQARRAARWKEMPARRRGLELCASLYRRERAVEAAATYTTQLRERRGVHEGAANELAIRETRYEQLGVDLEVRERALEEATEAHYRARARAELLQNNVGHHERELVALTERAARLEEQSGEQGRALERARAELTEVQAGIEATREQLATANDRLAERREALQKARAAEHEAVNATARTQRDLNDQRGRLARATGRLESAANERERLVARVEAAREQLASAARDEEAAAAAEATASSQRADADAARAAADAAHAEARDAEQAALRALHDAQQQQRAAEKQAVQASATVEALQASLARGEGYGKGVRALLAAATSGALHGVQRPLAERLRVDAEHEKRLAAVLGDWLGAICVDDAAALDAAASWAVEGGRAVALVACEGAVASSPIEWVRFVEPVPAWIADRLRAAEVRASAAAPGAVAAAVDDRGVFAPAPGVARVGGAAPAVSAVALGRRLDEAVQAAKDASGAVERTAAELRVAEEDLEQRLTTRATAREALDRAATGADAARRAHAQAADELARVGRRRAQAGDEVAASERRQADLDTQRQSFADEARDAEARIETLRAEVDRLEKQTDHARTDAQRCQDELSETASAQATVAERSRTLRDTERRLQQLLADATSRTTQIADERVTLDGRRKEVEASLADDRRALGSSLQLSDQAERKLAEVRAAFDECTAKRREAEAALSEVRRKAHEADQRVREMELKAERARTDVEHAESTLVERFGVTVEAAAEEAAGLTYDEAMRDEIAELTIKLERLGAVNPAAEEEFEEARERHEFLTTQRDDLESAMADLESAIRKMDRTSRDLFAEMFEAVNERFQAIYPRLFRGGRARLELTNPEDLLTTGVEIVVQPPGKKLQSMTLMSGGEKALTAVALIFAIFQLKPTPFCILDEVDAPLDDANVSRFAAMVEEMSAESQFLIITHNKTTMEAARTLYGVTMQEPGVSNVVGVRLHGRELQAEAPLG